MVAIAENLPLQQQTLHKKKGYPMSQKTWARLLVIPILLLGLWGTACSGFQSIGTSEQKQPDPMLTRSTIQPLGITDELITPNTVWLVSEEKASLVAVLPNGQASRLNLSISLSALPKLSPKGTYLAYLDESVNSTSKKLNILDIRTGTQVQFTPPIGNNILDFVFAPDDKRIVYTAYSSLNGVWALVITDILDKTQQILIQSTEYLKMPFVTNQAETLIPIGWKANDQLYLQSVRVNTGQVYSILTYHTITQDWRRILNQDSAYVVGRFYLSNDGRHLAYIAYDPQHPGRSFEWGNVIGIIDTETNLISTFDGPDPILGFNGNLKSILRWSPDDQLVFFLATGYDQNNTHGNVFWIIDRKQEKCQKVTFDPSKEIIDAEWTNEAIFYLVSTQGQTTLNKITLTEKNAEPQQIATLDGKWMRILKIW